MNIPKYVTLLRKQMELKRYAESSIMNYESALKKFLCCFDGIYAEPKKIPEKVIKDYLRELSSVSVLKQNIGCLKLFYEGIIRQPMKFKYIEYPRKEKKLPIPLSQEEIQRLFDACTNLKHKAILSVMYGAGLRISEVLNLKIKDIDSKNGVIWIIAGKGKKDRQTPLDQTVLNLLRNYYLRYRPKQYLFEGINGKYSATSIRKFLKRYCRCAKIREIHPHLLRHTFSTHTIESGIDISILQRILGHNSILSTRIYTHISPKIVANTESPISKINLNN